MLLTSRSQAARLLSTRIQPLCKRTYAFSANENKELNVPDEPKKVPNVSKTNEVAIDNPFEPQSLVESVEEAEKVRTMQAPNRKETWSRSQNPRARAMSGPRFEQTIMKYQPLPYAAIDLIHKQPVRWTHDRMVSCDGGGGPLGHPRIFINTDKPMVCHCTYCGLPFANEHHRTFLESLPSTPYPLEPQNDEAEFEESQRITAEPLGQR